MVEQSKQRESNFELYRIIVMLLIIAHHYVVNSGLTNGVISYEPTAFRSIFMYIFGAWGKTGINCFVLITGYFMCKSNITLKKFIKLIFEIIFYKIIFYIIFIINGYQEITLSNIIKTISPITSIDKGFVSCFIIFFLTIPFWNILINNITEKQHKYLIGLGLFSYTILSAIPGFKISFNYVVWFGILYTISSYIRMYDKEIFNNKKNWIIATISSILLATASILIFIKTGNSSYAYFLVSDSNSIFALLIGVSSFILIKNIKIKYNKWINMIGGSTFGVLLIHANSDTMRQWLWKDTLDNVGWFGTQYVFIHAILSVLSIFIVCIIIDIARIKLIERPIIGKLTKNR